jgi:hypothetical protein
MLFPENPDRVCMVTKNGDEVRILFFEPSGQSGGISLNVNDTMGLIKKLIEVCPEYIEQQEKKENQ